MLYVTLLKSNLSRIFFSSDFFVLEEQISTYVSLVIFNRLSWGFHFFVQAFWLVLARCRVALDGGSRWAPDPDPYGSTPHSSS